MDKKTIAIVILSLIILGGALYLGYNYVSNNIYNQGYNAGVIAVASSQTQTGNIVFINNQTIDTAPITQLCGIDEKA